MGYVHRWKIYCKRFSDEFLCDVNTVVLDSINILGELAVNEERVQFTDLSGYRPELFLFDVNNYRNRVQTGTFWINSYDKAVAAVLLLAIHHLNEQVEVSSDGLATFYVNKKTKGVSVEWEVAIQYVAGRFGYFFERVYSQKEFEKPQIKLIPIQLYK